MDPCFRTSRTARCRNVLFIMNKYSSILNKYFPILGPSAKCQGEMPPVPYFLVSGKRRVIGWRRHTEKCPLSPRRLLDYFAVTKGTPVGRCE